MPSNWADHGGPPTLLDHLDAERVAQALAVSKEDHKLVEEADWVTIREKIFRNTGRWTTPPEVILDSTEIIRRCKASANAANASKEDRHQ